MKHSELNVRKILHVDMDAFFASVEQRDNKKVANKPVVVGEWIVCAASYEARKYGIKSAMLTNEARKLCKGLIVIRADHAKYVEVSKQIMQIFKKYTDLVEPLSLDEAYLDVTVNKYNIPSATILGKMIKNEVFEKLGLTCSCGVSYNKFFAKVASDMRKPNGMYVITPDSAQEFINELPIYKFYGIGKKTAQKMIGLGIYTGEELREMKRSEMIDRFGVRGSFYYEIVRGVDRRPVVVQRKRKSLSKETTFLPVLKNKKEIMENAFKIFKAVYGNLLKEQIYTKTVSIKVRYSDFQTLTRSKSIKINTNKEQILYEIVMELFDKIPMKSNVRLIGIGFSNISKEKEVEARQEHLTITYNYK